jgi:DNA-binding CsgD family transcriptional regulator
VNGFRANESFTEWSGQIIDDYERRFLESRAECESSVLRLRDNGCEQVIVSPDAVGTVRIVLFDRFLDQIQEQTFVMVTSWGDFGPEAIVLDCVDRALARNIYVITDQHLSLLYVPLEHLKGAYLNLVRNQITGGYRVKLSRKEQILNLLDMGKSQSEIQSFLKISRSTYHRIMSDNSKNRSNNEIPAINNLDPHK